MNADTRLTIATQLLNDILITEAQRYGSYAFILVSLYFSIDTLIIDLLLSFSRFSPEEVPEYSFLNQEACFS